MQPKFLLPITRPAVWDFSKRVNGKMVRVICDFVTTMHSKSEQRDYRFRASVSSVLPSHTGLCVPLLSPLKQRAAVCSGFLFPSTLSLHPVTQPSSAAWPEVMATPVDPFPLNDTPPPLPAKKHRRQQQLEQQVTRKVDRAWGFQHHVRGVPSSFPALIFRKALQSVFLPDCLKDIESGLRVPGLIKLRPVSYHRAFQLPFNDIVWLVSRLSQCF